MREDDEEEEEEDYWRDGKDEGMGESWGWWLWCVSERSDQAETTDARCPCVKTGRGSGLVCVRLSISCCAVLSAGGW